MLTRLIAFLLIAESMFGAVRVAGLVPRLGEYDAIAVIFILLRGVVDAVQFAGGWMLASTRPQGFALAQWGFVAAAGLTVFDVGFNLAPTDIYYWMRWQVTVGYAVYALAAAAYLRAQRRKRALA
jgi:hypothetical protein